MKPLFEQLKHRGLALSCCVGLLISLLLTAGLLWLETAQAAENDEPQVRQQLADENNPFADGVKSYRSGDYRKARAVFENLHKQHPEDTKITYYLAITEAQLGRFTQAKGLYQEIMLLEPNGDAAALAKIGLTYLPPESQLDLPPRFQNPEQVIPQAAIPQQAGMPNNGAMATMPPGMSQQDMMAWQSLMGQMGSGKNGGMNPMMYMMPNGPGGTGATNYDPNAMSNMIMNQMLQNFSLDGGSDDNNK